MPTVLNIDGFRFFFYSNEHLPKHIHIEKAGKTAKYTIEFVEVIKSSGFNAIEIKQLRKLVETNQDILIQKWDEYFSN